MRLDPETSCEPCHKPLALCLCDAIRPLANRLHVLVLQHPQEPDVDLGSARLLTRSLPNSTLRVGLSWPNLRAALGPTFPGELHNPRWAALYLGSGVKEAPAGAGAAPRPGSPLVFLDRRGAPHPDQRPALDGLVLLDGTWSQAKTLWWRNAWLLKLRRAVLLPTRPSLYRELRREPRRECLSTIESAAIALEALGEPPETAAALRALFARLLDRARQYHPAPR